MNTFNQQAQIFKDKAYQKKLFFKKSGTIQRYSHLYSVLSPQNNTGHHVFSALGQISPSLQRCLSLDDEKLGILQFP